jgi:hypothetical protein
MNDEYTQENFYYESMEDDLQDEELHIKNMEKLDSLLVCNDEKPVKKTFLGFFNFGFKNSLLYNSVLEQNCSKETKKQSYYSCNNSLVKKSKRKTTQ